MKIERFDNYSDFEKRRAELESMKGHIVKSYCSIPKNKYELTYMVKEGRENA